MREDISSTRNVGVFFSCKFRLTKVKLIVNIKPFLAVASILFDVITSQVNGTITCLQNQRLEAPIKSHDKPRSSTLA